MSFKFDFEKLTIPIGRWATVWAQCMEDGYTREIWVGTETESCLIGHVEGKERTMEAVCELMNMMEAAKVLRGTT